MAKKVIDVSTVSKNIGEKLKALRQEKGQTQKVVSELINVSLEAYSKYERGVNSPSIDILIKLSEHYQVSLDYLIINKKSSINDEIAYILSGHTEENQKKILELVKFALRNFNI